MLNLALFFQKILTSTFQFLIALFKIGFGSSFSLKFPKSECKSLFVMGNGPSLIQDIDRINELDLKPEIMAVNFYNSSDLFKSTPPHSYVLCDPIFFKSKLPMEKGLRVDQTFRDIYNSQHGKLQLYIPFENKRDFKGKKKKLQLENNNVKVYFYNKTNVSGNVALANFFYKKRLCMPRPTTVLIPCLMIGIWSGYRQIYLGGADHDFHKDLSLDENNILHIAQNHFYPDEKKKVPFLKADGQSTYSMSEIFLVLHKMFGSYEYVVKFAKKCRVQLYNCTKGSFIDKIEKI